MSMYHANASKLQTAMRRRRDELRLSQRAAAERSDMSRISFIRYEKGEIPGDIRKSTLSNIDKALDWPEDHASKILEGVAAEEISAPTEVEVPQEIVEPTEDVTALVAEVDLRTLTKVAHAVANMRKTFRPLIPELPPEALDAMDTLMDAQTDLIIDLAEHLLPEDS